MFRRPLSFVILGICFCALPLSLRAVETTGIVEGLVADPTGAIIPGVKVTLTNEGTGEVRVYPTDQLGRFVFPNLPVGTYALRAEKEGFKTFVQTEIPVRVSEHLNLKVQLELGAVATEVEVRASVTTVDTKSSTLGNVIENREVVDLPLNGRNFLQLATLVSGSTPAIGYSVPANPETPGGITSSPQVNGLRAESNNYLLDGADNNEPFLGSAAVVPSAEAIEEFKVETNLYNAEFGSSAGAIVNVVTKSGTNDLHGSVYEFFRNDALDARNFFSPEVPVLKRNQFGFSVGGPIVRGQTFFFGNYEGFRQSSAETRTASVPTLLERQGDFSQSAVQPIDPLTGLPFPGGIILPGRFHPISVNLLPFYPAPNVGDDRVVSSPVVPSNNDQVLVKVDHKLRENDNLMIRYLFQDGDRSFEFVPSFLGAIDVPGFPAGDKFQFQNVVISNTHLFSPTTILQSHFSYNRADLDAAVAQFAIDAGSLGFTFPVPQEFHNIPLLAISGLTSIGTSNFTGDTIKVNNIFNFENSLSISRGRHLIKLGFRHGSTQINLSTLTGFNGNYLFAGAATGNPFADFLLGQSLLFLQIGGDGVRYFRTKEYTYYIQDSISLTPHLNLNLGFRHEITTPIFDRGRRMPAWRPGEQSQVRPSVPPGVLYPGDPGITRSTYTRDNNNLGPRIGLAWDPFKDGKTSVRAGFGMSYDPPVAFIVFQTIVAPSILNIAQVFFPPDFADPFLGSSIFQPGTTVFPVTPGTQVNYVAPDLKTPYVIQYNLTIQREIAAGYVFQVGYVGTQGRNLLGTVEVNAPVFIPGGSTAGNINARRPVQPWGQVFEQRSGFSSGYNSLQASLTKNWSHGLALLASYTYAKSIDVVSVPQQFQSVDGQPPNVIAANPRDLDAERAASSFDVRQRFVLSASWELPFFKNTIGAASKVLDGWQLNGILQLQSALPFTVYDNTDPNIDGETSDRPDLVGSCHPSGFSRTIDRDFDTSAFIPIPAGSNQFGTAGRNVCRGRSFQNIDFSILKKFDLSERIGLQFRAEFFNLFNHPNFSPPVSDINSPSFGRIVKTLPLSERQIQFGLKLTF